MKEPIIINIQKFSVHDGDGIRTTIFFKGCHLHCWWCHNPESQRYQQELMFNREKCTGCGYCSKVCSHDAISIESDKTAHTDISKCVLCSDCLDYCMHNNREIVGKTYSIKELIDIVKRDAIFYEESGGGVTLSGGEVMTQNIEYLEELCKQLKDKGFNVAVDTCGYAPIENYERVLPYVDTWLYDIKTLDEEAHINYMGKSNDVILENLEFLAKNKACINIRIPVVVPVNNDEATMKNIVHYIKENVGIVNVNLLPYHTAGRSKYEKLGRVYPANSLRVPSNENMENIKVMFEKAGFKQVKIGG